MQTWTESGSSDKPKLRDNLQHKRPLLFKTPRPWKKKKDRSCSTLKEPKETGTKGGTWPWSDPGAETTIIMAIKTVVKTMDRTWMGYGDQTAVFLSINFLILMVLLWLYRKVLLTSWKYMMKYLGHYVCNVLSNGSENNVCVCVLVCVQQERLIRETKILTFEESAWRINVKALSDFCTFSTSLKLIFLKTHLGNFAGVDVILTHLYILESWALPLP